MIDDDNEEEEVWEDSGAYAQMFAFARKQDAEGVPTGEYRNKNGGGDKENQVQVVIPKEDPDNVMFLRKGFNQNIVAGLVAFTGPGLFNAMQGLGNAGGSDPSVRVCGFFVSCKREREECHILMSVLMSMLSFTSSTSQLCMVVRQLG